MKDLDLVDAIDAVSSSDETYVFQEERRSLMQFGMFNYPNSPIADLISARNHLDWTDWKTLIVANDNAARYWVGLTLDVHEERDLASEISSKS